ncbi:HD domain-containing protein [Bradyrhizobium sp. SRS-191]|uniref:HD domain-containing protein n=1 Tax=Bradyrhizobium sp. SRS-191 TaxID=2962606 RepID=UPI00211DB120|nr:HD domain-containing protein [Bradyrhizobium sp. SRS-191]
MSDTQLSFDQVVNPEQTQSISYQPIKFDKTIRIAVTGDVRVTRAERRIIDTPEFQRLRGVKQLGPSSWVYPTAVHTRFDHSLGVLQMVDEMVQSIREIVFQVPVSNGQEAIIEITDTQRKLARLYGLLHDVTHVPFGHTLEDELGIFPSHDAFQKAGTHQDGLDRFELLLGDKSQIGQILIEEHGHEFYSRFKNIFVRGGRDRLQHSEGGRVVCDEIIYFLVSDTVCADLLDYVKRDSFFSSIDLNLSFRFLKFMYVADVPIASLRNERRRRLVIRLWKPKTGRARRDIMTDLAGLMEARYMIAERIYFHPTKLIVGAMIGRAVLEAKRLRCLSAEELLAHSDDSLLRELIDLDKLKGGDPEEQKSRKIASKLALAVVHRRLFKCQHRYTDKSFGRAGDNVNLKEDALHALKDADRRRDIENEIADWGGVNHGDVLVYAAPRKMNSKVADVQVDWQGQLVRLSDISDPVLSNRLKTIEAAHKELWGIDLIVSDELSAEQREQVQFAFEAKFLGRERARECYMQLARDVIDQEEKFSNYPPESKRKTARTIADKLAEAGLAFHGKASVRTRIVELASEIMSDRL